MAVIRKKRETVQKALEEVQLKAREEEEVRARAWREVEEKLLEEAVERARAEAEASRWAQQEQDDAEFRGKSGNQNQTRILSCLQRSVRTPTPRRTGTTSRRTSWTSTRGPPQRRGRERRRRWSWRSEWGLPDAGRVRFEHGDMEYGVYGSEFFGKS